MLRFAVLPILALASEDRRLQTQCNAAVGQTNGRTVLAAACYCGESATFDGEEVYCEVGKYCIRTDLENGSAAGGDVEGNCVEDPICENMEGEHPTPEKCSCYEYESNIMITCATGESCLAHLGELECKNEDYTKMAMGNLRTLPRAMHGHLNVLTCGFIENHYSYGTYYNTGSNGGNRGTACSDPKHWKYTKANEARALDPTIVETGRVEKFQSHYDKNCCKTLGPNALAGIIVAAVIVFLGLLIVLGCCRRSSSAADDEE